MPGSPAPSSVPPSGGAGEGAGGASADSDLGPSPGPDAGLDAGLEAALDAALVRLLDARAATASVCPSEVARAVAAERGQEEWRSLMGPARAAAQRLVAGGQAQVTQGARVVDPSTARGPIRVRRPR